MNAAPTLNKFPTDFSALFLAASAAALATSLTAAHHQLATETENAFLLWMSFFLCRLAGSFPSSRIEKWPLDTAGRHTRPSLSLSLSRLFLFLVGLGQISFGMTLN